MTILSRASHEQQDSVRQSYIIHVFILFENVNFTNHYSQYCARSKTQENPT